MNSNLSKRMLELRLSLFFNQSQLTRYPFFMPWPVIDALRGIGDNNLVNNSPIRAIVPI